MRVRVLMLSHTAVHGLVGDGPTNVRPVRMFVTRNTGPTSPVPTVIRHGSPKAGGDVPDGARGGTGSRGQSYRPANAPRCTSPSAHGDADRTQRERRGDLRAGERSVGKREALTFVLVVSEACSAYDTARTGVALGSPETSMPRRRRDARAGAAGSRARLLAAEVLPLRGFGRAPNAGRRRGNPASDQPRPPTRSAPPWPTQACVFARIDAPRAQPRTRSFLPACAPGGAARASWSESDRQRRRGLNGNGCRSLVVCTSAAAIFVARPASQTHRLRAAHASKQSRPRAHTSDQPLTCSSRRRLAPRRASAAFAKRVRFSCRF